MYATNKRLIILLSAAMALLLIPLIAMVFTTEVDWAIGDFLVAGILLGSAALAIESTLRLVASKRSRFLFVLLIVFVLLLLWAELAVGIFGSIVVGR